MQAQSQQLCNEVTTYLWSIIRCQLCSMLVYDHFRFFVGCFSIYLLAFPCTKREYCLCIQILNQVVPNESTIPTYMWYSFAVLSKFLCAISKFQNKFLFCVLVLLMKWQGVADIFPCQICYSQVECYSLVIAREYGKGTRDAQSQNEK